MTGINQEIFPQHVNLYLKNYIFELAIARPGAYTLRASQIQKMEVLQKDAKRTTNSYVLGGLGITLGVVVLTLFIAAASYAGIY